MISKNEFEHIAKLSMLTFSEDEQKNISSDMLSVISFADMIAKAQHTDMQCETLFTPLREDETISSYERDDILKNAPSSEDGYFKLLKRSEDI